VTSRACCRCDAYFSARSDFLLRDSSAREWYRVRAVGARDAYYVFLGSLGLTLERLFRSEFLTRQWSSSIICTSTQPFHSSVYVSTIGSALARAFFSRNLCSLHWQLTGRLGMCGSELICICAHANMRTKPKSINQHSYIHSSYLQAMIRSTVSSVLDSLSLLPHQAPSHKQPSKIVRETREYNIYLLQKNGPRYEGTKTGEIHWHRVFHCFITSNERWVRIELVHEWWLCALRAASIRRCRKIEKCIFNKVSSRYGKPSRPNLR